jgi:hypothetical protein
MSDRDADLQAFERRIGTPLPEDYRQFLLGGPLPVWTEEESPENPFTELRYSLYDLDASEDRLDLTSTYEARGSDLPDWFLEIGEQFGVLIGIGISGPQCGRVYQWSWDDGEERELDASFEAFLARIRREEERWDE